MKMQPFKSVCLPALLLLEGNCGKAFEVRGSKKSQSKEELRRSREELRRSREDLTGESRSLLDSEDDLDREEVLNPEPENRSVSAPMRPEPTEHDRLVFAASSQFSPSGIREARVTASRVIRQSQYLCHLSDQFSCLDIIGQLLLFLNCSQQLFASGLTVNERKISVKITGLVLVSSKCFKILKASQVALLMS